MAWRESLDIGDLTVNNFSMNYGYLPLYKNATGTNTLGTLVSGTTAVHYTMDNIRFKSILTVASFTVDTVAAAALGLGKKVYTLPAGSIVINGGSFTATATPSGATLDTDQPYMGVGTVIASGAVADLTGTATFDDICTQDQVDAAFSGAVAKTALNTTGSSLGIPAASAHTVHLNIADTWAGQDAALALAGTITLDWAYV
jgi:hypothetical protein